MRDTGVIKFNCSWIKEDPLDAELIKDLNAWRDTLYKAGFIGEDNHGIGYGNISIRFQKNQFVISGSATGKFQKLTNEHYTKVVEYNLDKNSLTAIGPIVASSESLTHAVIYEQNEAINAVMHIHNADLWKKLLYKIPTTKKEIEYGTPAMAREVMRLFKETNLPKQKIFAMAGHEDGIVSFGRNLKEAGDSLFAHLI